MTIAATRMQRSLVDFTSGSTEVYDILHFLSLFQCLVIARTHESRPLSSLVFSKTKRRRDTVPTTLDGINVSVNRVFEQGSTGSKNDGDTSTVFSTSEKIPQMTGEPSKLDLTQASAHPQLTVSLSPIRDAESA